MTKRTNNDEAIVEIVLLRAAHTPPRIGLRPEFFNRNVAPTIAKSASLRLYDDGAHLKGGELWTI